MKTLTTLVAASVILGGLAPSAMAITERYSHINLLVNADDSTSNRCAMLLLNGGKLARAACSGNGWLAES
ncbi:MAG: hypothetical protein HRT35_08215 [Algicola sp.]|nr:hypothetical protein [Algicola sp.]